MTSPKLLPILVVLALLGIAFFVGYCNRESKQTTEPQPRETYRIKSFNADSIKRAAYQEAEAKYLSQISGLKRELAAATVKDKQATEKAQQSAATFAQTPTLGNCKVALTDCQQEVGTKAAVITVLTAQVATVLDKRKGDSAEINRLLLRTDTLNLELKGANSENAKLTESLAKQKRKRWGIGPNISATIINGKPAPVGGVGIQYNFIRF